MDDLDLATPDLAPLLAWLGQATAPAGSPLARVLLAVESAAESQVDTLILLEEALTEAREETRRAAWARTQNLLAAARAVPDGGAALRAALSALDQTDPGETPGTGAPEGRNKAGERISYPAYRRLRAADPRRSARAR